MICYALRASWELSDDLFLVWGIGCGHGTAPAYEKAIRG